MKNEPKKKGFLISNKKMKKSRINMNKTVKDMPVSLFLNEDWE